MKRYLRVRLRKIELNIFYLFKNNLHSFFSNDEFTYAVEYYKILVA